MKKIAKTAAGRKDWWKFVVRADIQRRPRPIGKRAPRLAAILDRAARSSILSNWQLQYCMDLAVRFRERGADLVLTPKQRAALAKIAQRLGESPL